MFGVHDLLFNTTHFQNLKGREALSEIRLGEEMKNLTGLDLKGIVFEALALAGIPIVLGDDREKQQPMRAKHLRTFFKKQPALAFKKKMQDTEAADGIIARTAKIVIEEGSVDDPRCRIELARQLASCNGWLDASDIETSRREELAIPAIA